MLREETCDIKINDAPISLRKEFKALCAAEGKDYKEMLKVLMDYYKKKGGVTYR